MSTSDFAIETAGLTRRFGQRTAVDSLTLQVPRGSVYAFLGRNGSGKTTTIRMLLGFLPPTSGSAKVLGCDSMALPPAVRARIGYTSETHPVHEWMTVAQEGWFASQFHERWDAKLFDSLLEPFAVRPDAKTGTLSRGQRAGLSLALALAPQPELLILDDPANGLDPVARAALMEMLLRATRDSGRTVLLSSHQLDDVERVADYAAVLDYSVLRAAGPVDDLAASVVQYRLTFAPGSAPALTLPAPGVLSVKRVEDALLVTALRHSEDARAAIAGLGHIAVQERPVSFAEAVMVYLGSAGDVASHTTDAVLSAAGGAR